MGAKEFLDDKLVNVYFKILLVNFARYHVEKALKAANDTCKAGKAGKDYMEILNAYPLENIK